MNSGVAIFRDDITDNIVVTKQQIPWHIIIGMMLVMIVNVEGEKAIEENKNRF